LDFWESSFLKPEESAMSSSYFPYRTLPKF